MAAASALAAAMAAAMASELPLSSGLTVAIVTGPFLRGAIDSPGSLGMGWTTGIGNGSRLTVWSSALRGKPFSTEAGDRLAGLSGALAVPNLFRGIGLQVAKGCKCGSLGGIGGSVHL